MVVVAGGGGAAVGSGGGGNNGNSGGNNPAASWWRYLPTALVLMDLVDHFRYFGQVAEVVDYRCSRLPAILEQVEVGGGATGKYIEFSRTSRITMLIQVVVVEAGRGSANLLQEQLVQVDGGSGIVIIRYKFQ